MPILTMFGPRAPRLLLFLGQVSGRKARHLGAHLVDFLADLPMLHGADLRQVRVGLLQLSVRLLRLRGQTGRVLPQVGDLLRLGAEHDETPRSISVRLDMANASHLGDSVLRVFRWDGDSGQMSARPAEVDSIRVVLRQEVGDRQFHRLAAGGVVRAVHS
jgi:hypothetical protein